MDSGRTQPVLLGGLFIGVLSALPVVNIGNCCCCMWILAGGVLAVYLRQQNFLGELTAAEGALVGMLAGLVGGVIGALISIPLEMLLGTYQQELISRILESNPDVPAEMRDMMQKTVAGGAIRGVFALVNVVISSVFGLLGGLLGVAIFKKKTPPPPPPTMIPHDPGVAQ